MLRALSSLIRDIPDLIHRRADSMRVRRYGHAELWAREGMPGEWIDRQNALPLAWANLLDALARRGPFRKA